MTFDRHLRALRESFRRRKDKRQAHVHARAVLQDLSGNGRFLTEILERHLLRPGTLRTPHYPVIAIPIERNADFELVANCWIPLPDGDTRITTKAIHHHGSMLLSTVTAFGPGYDHWTFSPPAAIGADAYTLKLASRGLHQLHDVAFVDTLTPHVPFFPSSLTITYALWSTSVPTGWRDFAKALQPVRRRAARLKALGERLGLAQKLDLKIVRDFDFFPSAGSGFRVLHQRQEFPLGPAEDHVRSLMHVFQRTANPQLGRRVLERLESGDAQPETVPILRDLVESLESGSTIEPRLSKGHYGVSFANFSDSDIGRALG